MSPAMTRKSSPTHDTNTRVSQSTRCRGPSQPGSPPARTQRLFSVEARTAALLEPLRRVQDACGATGVPEPQCPSHRAGASRGRFALQVLWRHDRPDRGAPWLIGRGDSCSCVARRYSGVSFSSCSCAAPSWPVACDSRRDSSAAVWSAAVCSEAVSGPVGGRRRPRNRSMRTTSVSWAKPTAHSRFRPRPVR